MTKIHKVLTILLCVALWQHSANAQTGNVGIGNNNPVTRLDVAGDLALREGTAINVSGANPTVPISLHATNAENSFYRITGSPTGTMALNTIANGVDGQIITLVNATTIKLKISKNDVAGGILTSGGAATLIAPNGSVTLQYSTSAARWYVTNAAGATITDWTKATTTDETAISTDNQYVTGNVGLGGHTGGNGDNTYSFANNAPAVPLVVVSPGSATAASSPTTTGIRLAQPGTKGTKWPISADFKLGSYATSGVNAQSQLDIALGDGGGNTPDVTVMSILGNKQVGINRAAPLATLHVVAPSASTAFAARFTQTNTTTGNNTFIGLSTENNTWSKAAIGFQRTNSYDVGDITFNLNSNASSGTDVSTSDEMVRITSAGNVGISNTAPNQLLQVSNGSKTMSMGTSDASAGFWIRNDGSNPVISTKVGDMYYGYSGRNGLSHRFYVGSPYENFLLSSDGNIYIGNPGATSNPYILPRNPIGGGNPTYLRLGSSSNGFQDIYSGYVYATQRIMVGSTSSPNNPIHVTGSMTTSVGNDQSNYMVYIRNTGSGGGAIMTDVQTNANSSRYLQCRVNGSEVGCLYGNGSNVLSLYS
ncbi:MAG TPA: hypothetical protein PKD40_07930, partial [Saprospiraceae bacterium]|nr:hypothetical protein [Saprospiraceae bacterium]